MACQTDHASGDGKTEAAKEIACARAYVLEAGERYWAKGRACVADLPLPVSEGQPACEFRWVQLPDWAADLGVGDENALLVDASFVLPGEGPAHCRCDWLMGAFHHLTGAVERAHERLCGPTHSYFMRLRKGDRTPFQYAWVNRIFLFLRRWAARNAGREETSVFGALPAWEIRLTHDVDAVTKTAPIRLKQSAFHLINAGRACLRGDLGLGGRKLVQAAKFAGGAGNYDRFAEICRLEEQAGVRSVFNFYGHVSARAKTAKTWIFNPGYDVTAKPLRERIAWLNQGGWQIGLHQAFDSWRDADRMRAEKQVLESVLGEAVRCCRQHWLRFSWEHTWRAQQEAGLLQDSTLGFNDIPGFRNGSALEFHPYDFETRKAMRLSVCPLVLMDSHFYDYAGGDDASPLRHGQRYLQEVKAVHGTAAIVWHQRVFDPDYGWGDTYAQLLREVF